MGDQEINEEDKIKRRIAELNAITMKILTDSKIVNDPKFFTPKESVRIDPKRETEKMEEGKQLIEETPEDKAPEMSRSSIARNPRTNPLVSKEIMRGEAQEIWEARKARAPARKAPATEAKIESPEKPKKLLLLSSFFIRNLTNKSISREEAEAG